MITAGIKELKNQLSRYMGYVKRGDDVLITERGRVIARVVKEGSPRVGTEENPAVFITERTNRHAAAGDRP
jgi:prevent-host-death family protein